MNSIIKAIVVILLIVGAGVGAYQYGYDTAKQELGYQSQLSYSKGFDEGVRYGVMEITPMCSELKDLVYCTAEGPCYIRMKNQT
jgi:hypothetical protein